VLYFPGHSYAYYLAHALPAASLVLAGVVLPDLALLGRGRAWLASLGLAGLIVMVAQPMVRRDGRWWIDRTFQARSFIRQMRVIDARVPDDRTVFVIGMSPEDRGVLQEDAALKAYGFSMRKYILVGMDPRTPGQIRHLAGTGELKDLHCYVFFEGALRDWTDLFRRDPETVLLLNQGYLERPDVRLEVDPVEVKRGADTLRVHVVGLDAAAIDMMYAIDGELMPPLRDWQLGPGGTLVVAVGTETRHGLYRYKAIRDSASRGPDSWILVDVQVWVD
jgi:hypothetical protein